MRGAPKPNPQPKPRPRVSAPHIPQVTTVRGQSRDQIFGAKFIDPERYRDPESGLVTREYWIARIDEMEASWRRSFWGGMLIGVVMTIPATIIFFVTQ